MTPIASRSFAQKTAVGDEAAKSSVDRGKTRRRVHRLDLDLDEIALGVESGIASAPRRGRAAGPRTAGSSSARSTSAIRRWPKLEQVLRQAGRRGRRRPRRTTRGPAERRWSSSTSAMPRVGQPFEIALVLAGRVDDHAANALPGEGVERSPFVGEQPVRVADHDRLAVGRRQILDAAGDLREERVPDVGDDQADERRLPGPERRGRAVGHPPELLDRDRAPGCGCYRRPGPGRLTTFETVPTETPACSATWLIVMPGS